LVAFTSAKTLSPGMRLIFWTERVVMIDAISPMLVSTITSLMTLSDTMLFTVPGSWFRMLSSISGEDSAKGSRCQWSAIASEAAVGANGYSEKTRRDLLKACALQVRCVKRIALVKIAGLVAAAKPARTLFGSAVCK
jgi:hypothetical protein